MNRNLTVPIVAGVGTILGAYALKKAYKVSNYYPPEWVWLAVSGGIGCAAATYAANRRII